MRILFTLFTCARVRNLVVKSLFGIKIRFLRVIYYCISYLCPHPRLYPQARTTFAPPLKCALHTFSRNHYNKRVQHIFKYNWSYGQCFNLFLFGSYLNNEILSFSHFVIAWFFWGFSTIQCKLMKEKSTHIHQNIYQEIIYNHFKYILEGKSWKFDFEANIW